MSTPRPRYDVLIAGGGMVGASMALALARLGLAIGVVEPRPVQSGSQPSYDDRCTALSAGSQRLLEQMQVWPLLAEDTTPIKHIHVSDRGHYGFTRLHAEEEGVNALGYLIPNRVFGTRLYEAITWHDNIDILCPASVTDVTFNRQGAAVTISADGNQATTQTNLLIASDGARSPLRERLGVSSRRHDYGQTAIITNLTPEADHGNWAYERFAGHGPVALLPMSDNRMGAVWVVQSDAAPAILELDDKAFVSAIQARFGYRLGHFVRAGKRIGYPLTLLRAKKQVDNHFAIIGNAAHALHPVAGQGFNLSLRDVATLAETIGTGLEQGEQPGALPLLQRYASQRRRDQTLTIGLTHTLLGAFGSRIAPVTKVRNLGLLGMDLAPGIKHRFAKQAMGLAGRLPRIPS